MASCPRVPPGRSAVSSPVLREQGCTREEVCTGAFAKGTADVEPGFLFVWDSASPCSAVTRKRKANKGFSDGLRALSPLFSRGEKGNRDRPSKSWPGGAWH